MDPLTHGLAGAAIKNLGFKRDRALFVLLLASVAPDLDYIVRPLGADLFLRYHRGITHGVLALLAVPVLIGILSAKRGFFYYSFLAFTGYAFHLLLDLTNQYGTRVLSPLDWRQYSLDLTFIIDPYVSLGFLVSVLLAALNRKRARTIALATFMLLAFYMGVRYYFQEKTEEFLRARLDDQIARVYPLPNDFMRWWFVARSGDTVSTGFADLFTGRVYVQDRYVVRNDPAIERSKGQRVVKNFLNFAKYPHAEVERHNGQTVVIWRELAYGFLPGEHFEARVVMDGRGRVVSSKFRF
jgi:inner membrane protein